MFRKKETKEKWIAIDSYYDNDNDIFTAGMGQYDTLEEAKVQVVKAAGAYRDMSNSDVDEKNYNDSNGLVIEIKTNLKTHWLYTKKL